MSKLQDQDRGLRFFEEAVEELSEENFEDYSLTSRKRVYRPGQILSPKKLKVGMTVIVVGSPNSQFIYDDARELRVITFLDFDTSVLSFFEHTGEKFNERMEGHRKNGNGFLSTIETLLALMNSYRFDSLSLVRGKEGEWDNRSWLEYP